MADRTLGGRYRLGAPLGRGGMAVVWRAEDLTLGREVAVKTLDLTGPDRDSSGARFEREAKATARLNHPNIVRVYDSGLDGDTAYIVMELIDGPTLAERVRDEGPLPVTEVRQLAAGVAPALASAHAAGIVHRDIKPNNIAYTSAGRPIVLDFGITQLLDDAAGPGLTKTNTIVGTAEYLSPEQATGQPVDQRADLYALGCVLFFALTGHPPFEGPTAVSTLMKHVQDPAPSVARERPGVPADLDAAIAQLLAKDPDERPANAAEAAAILSGARAATPPTAVLAPGPAPTEVLRQTDPLPVVPGGPPPRPLEPPRSGTAWLGWALALLLLLGGGYLAWQVIGDTGSGNAPTTQTQAPPSTVTSLVTSNRTVYTSQSSSTTSASSSASTTPPTTSTAPTTVTTDPRTAAANLRGAVAQAVVDGRLQQDGAEALTERLDAIDAAIGKPGQLRKAVDAFGAEVSALRDDEEIDEAGVTALAGPYQAMQAAAG